MIKDSAKAKPLLLEGFCIIILSRAQQKQNHYYLRNFALSNAQRISKSKTTITLGILPYHMIKGSAKAKPLLHKDICLII